MEVAKNTIVKYGILKGLTYLASTGSLAFIGGNTLINGEELISLDNLYALIGALLVLFVPKLLDILQNVIPTKTDSAVSNTINRATSALQEEFKVELAQVRNENKEIINLLKAQNEQRDNILNNKA